MRKEVIQMQKSLFPGYTIGVDAYDDIKNVCPAYGKKVAVIGGKRALAAAKEGILKGAEEAGLEVIGVFWYGGEAVTQISQDFEKMFAESEEITKDSKIGRVRRLGIWQCILRLIAPLL